MKSREQMKVFNIRIAERAFASAMERYRQYYKERNGKEMDKAALNQFRREESEKNGIVSFFAEQITETGQKVSGVAVGVSDNIFVSVYGDFSSHGSLSTKYLLFNYVNYRDDLLKVGIDEMDYEAYKRNIERLLEYLFVEALIIPSARENRAVVYPYNAIYDSNDFGTWESRFLASHDYMVGSEYKLSIWVTHCTKKRCLDEQVIVKTTN